MLLDKFHTHYAKKNADCEIAYKRLFSQGDEANELLDTICTVDNKSQNYIPPTIAAKLAERMDSLKLSDLHRKEQESPAN
ncbi:MAG: hypothetical protein RMZ41_001445 [Nostoc sp. DedVER02]|uniref:hypothetical protein n=1 Tax=unclassified Nostoc TaxID=2593658 RepID=UPI002AD43B5E|nr:MULTISPECIES: hypothetical protein [unclassified Nostoc]MDZ7987173.1 hypothetical protein [Nostoc sp. DedVER02]MDZ8110956.1 hypothetical protein [Nostoc sp. DedVER01b]